jgi:hypothetical protein
VAVDSTIADLDELLDASRQVRRHFEPQWILNIAMYLGKQWIKVDAAGMLFDVNLGEGQTTLVDNRIRKNVRVNIAKQTKQRPNWVGVPKDPSDEEIQRARLRSIVFEHYWRELNARRKLRSALWYRDTCGAGFWKVLWDQTAGEKTLVLARPGGGPVLVDEHGRPMTPETLQGAPVDPVALGQVEPREIATGDVSLELRSPFEMLPDDLATEEGLETCEHIGEEAIHKIEDLRRRYPDADLEGERPGSAGIMESRFPGLSNMLKHGRTNPRNKGGRGVKVREIWTKDKHCVWTANGTMLLEEDNPYPFKPYVMFGGLPSGRFWTDAPVTDQVSPQVELNKTSSQIADNAERFGNPARLIASEAQVDDWQGLPGEEVVFQQVTGNPAYDMPSYLSGPEMPAYVQNRIPQIIEALNNASSQQEVAQGTVPEGVTAASAISMLLEANDTVLGPEIEEMGDALVEGGRMILWYLRSFAKTERMARIAGDESMWDIYAFQGEKLGDADADEVEVGSTITSSAAMQQESIRNMLNLLIQNGQVPPPRELRRLMRALNVGGMDNFFATIGRVQRFVSEEHRRMMSGEMLGQGQVDPVTQQPITTNSFDDDQTHLEEHQDYQMSASYQEAIRKPGGQVIAQLFEAHTAEHRAKLQAAANQQAMAQASMAALENGTMGPGADMAGAASAGAATNGNGSVPPEGAVPS